MRHRLIKLARGGFSHSLMLCIVWAVLVGMGSRLQGQFLPSSDPSALLDEVFDPQIHSVYFGPGDWILSPPIISAKGSQPLVLFFDYLGAVSPRYVYRVVHCTEDWVPSGEDAGDRFAHEWIWFDSPGLSMATRVPFFHYGVRIPNEWVRLRWSGNYVLQVADALDGYRVVLQRQFAVSEDLMEMIFRVDTHMGGGFPPAYVQRVRLSVQKQTSETLTDPSLYVLYLKQNWPSRCVRHLEARVPMMAGEVPFGDFFGEQYLSGEEWQTLDLRSLGTPGEGVNRIETVGYESHVEVLPYIEGRRMGYGAKRDLNGYCLPGMQRDFSQHGVLGGQLQPLESDYAWCYFSFIPAAGARIDRQVELWVGGDRYPMVYSVGRGQYEVNVLLKQGVYNYRYGYAGDCPESDRPGGSYRETDNEYYALLYYRDPLLRYARLVGWGRYSFDGANPRR